jgi:hypothetical protein
MSERIRRTVPRLSLNQQEAAEALGVSVTSFERHIKPHLGYVLVGARKLYPVRELEAFLNRESLHGGRRRRGARLMGAKDDTRHSYDGGHESRMGFLDQGGGDA